MDIESVFKYILIIIPFYEKIKKGTWNFDRIKILGLNF